MATSWQNHSTVCGMIMMEYKWLLKKADYLWVFFQHIFNILQAGDKKASRCILCKMQCVPHTRRSSSDFCFSTWDTLIDSEWDIGG